MEKVEILPGQDYITLGQLLKYTGVIDTGGQAKWFLSENSVWINNEPDNRRGKKLYAGDQITIENIGNYIVQR
ncbi:S4 domain protein YaaA [Scopulibacillus darangshiensis]|uniref:S4 domain protein YaaA n=1 Tax=Scopulibacillus darangshiensis TaxID=442528 RepID=A0A4R2NKV7_9BACL|nr:S4 domain-containing protein YaaA [Scopulibacillus darangshiensis]TCP22150.1 S4 domain protein YaaA [Scopulibacillus darangshiensis]